MPVKLSGDLVEEARASARLFHRSLTSQIEHWATLGKAIESRLSTDALAPLLADGKLKISDATKTSTRDELCRIFLEFYESSENGSDEILLKELRSHGVPLYGLKKGGKGIVQRDPDGREARVSEKNSKARS